MYSFDYQRPQDTATAAKIVTADGDALYLAGGQTLIPTLKQRLAQPSTLVDLSGIPGLKGIKVSSNTVVIGATTTHAEVTASAEMRKAIPALADLASLIGDAQVRNLGTIGGSIANADPAADYPAAVVGLGATVKTDRREIAGDDFFTGLFETALQPGELIVSVSFPVPSAAAYEKLHNPASGYAVVGVMVAKTKDGVRVGVTGAGPSAFRETGLEKILGKDFSATALKGAEISAGDLNNDLHATAAYRANAVRILTERAVARLA